jgi:hypothetical protein
MNNSEQLSRGTNFLLLLGLAGLLLLLGLLLAAGGRQGATAAPAGVQSADGLWQDVDEAVMRPAP